MKAGAESGADVSIIIVTYNSEPYLGRSLESVANSHEVIVVDNASTDGSRDVVRQRYPFARLLPLETNVGFGSACNEGMRVASGRYFLLMNPDAWPAGNGAIEELVRHADERPRVAALGPRLRSPDGETQPTAFGYPTALWLGRPAVSSVRRRPSGPASLLAAVGRAASNLINGDRIFLVGAVLMLRREAVIDVGGFDPRFFMFNEEVDLCWRFRRGGWSVERCAEAEFVHVGGSSTAEIWASMYREQLRGHLLFLAKHRGIRHAELARHVLLVATRIRARRTSSPDANAFRAAGAWLASGNAEVLIGGEP